MARPRRALAPVVHAAPPSAPISKLVGAIPRFDATPDHDQHDIAVGVVIGLNLAFLEGRVVELIAEARNSSGSMRLGALRKAQRYLEQACRQAEGAAS